MIAVNSRIEQVKVVGIGETASWSLFHRAVVRGKKIGIYALSVEYASNVGGLLHCK